MAGKATLYGAEGAKKVVDIGSKEASSLQSQGWGLTEGSYKAPKAKANPQQNLAAQQKILQQMKNDRKAGKKVDSGAYNRQINVINKLKRGMAAPAESNSQLANEQKKLQQMKDDRKAGKKVDSGAYNRQINVINKMKKKAAQPEPEEEAPLLKDETNLDPNNKATLWGPDGEKKAVIVGSQEAANLQKSGWGLQEGSYKEPGQGTQATLHGPDGKKVVVDVGSEQASKLQSQGWGLQPGSYKGKDKPAVGSQQERDRLKQDQRNQDIADAEAAQKKAEDATQFKMHWADDIPGMPKMPADSYPQVPDLVQTYQDLREAEGLEGLETKLNDRLAEMDALDDAYDEGKYNMGQEMSPMTLIRGEQAELQEQYIRQRNSKQRTIDALQRTLDGKNATVSMMMQFTQQNFDNAAKSYNDRFDNAMKFQQQWYTQFKDERDYARLISNDAKDRDFQERQMENTIKQQEIDNGRANATILMNTMAESGKGWDDLSQAEKNNFAKIEQQAGLPAGSLQAFGRAKPEAQLLGQTNGVDKDGNDIITFIYKDKDGNPGTMITRQTGGFTDQSGSGGGGASYYQGITGADEKGGLAFADDDGNPITAGQYAAKKKQNIASILEESGNPDDRDVIDKFINGIMLYDINNATGSNRTSEISKAYGFAQKNIGWIFNGVSLSEFKQIMGV